VVRIIPPLVTTEQEIDQSVSILAEALAATS
jgi:4-aminobutyrate aminotransferase-like enzyme